MKTNFFELLENMKVQGDWQIVIRNTSSDTWLVSVLLSNDNCRDDARKLVPPMILHGTPSELGEGFFSSIQTPAEKTAKLFSNMEGFIRQLDAAKKQSKMEQEKQDQEKKKMEDLKKKYEAQMKKVEELEEKEKWGEAIAQLPQIEQFPEQEEEIRRKSDELRKRHNNLSLF